jgi:lipid-A-disaccharide synthase
MSESVFLQDAPVFALVAGERSGDILAADLIRGLKHAYPNARFVGIGGPLMQAEGLVSWFEMERLSVMGFFEVLKHLPSLLKLRRQLINQLLALKPDVFIGVDAPDFNFYVERQLKQAGIKTVHYVGPSVWAWRQNRLKKIKQSVDGMLVLFPFEPEIYQRYQIPVAFVGHPLANQVPDIPNSTQSPFTIKFTFRLPANRSIAGFSYV